jgi:hypothetical protein
MHPISLVLNHAHQHVITFLANRLLIPEQSSPTRSLSGSMCLLSFYPQVVPTYGY